MSVVEAYPVDFLDLVPDLPKPTQRWTIEEVCALYSISVDEFLAWERDINRYGAPGLRTTRVQIYRATDKKRER